MDRFSKLVIAAALGLAGVAHAGYAQLANPPGFSMSGGGFSYAPNAVNDSVFGRIIHQPNGFTTNVGGQMVKMPAAYRLAANAPRIAAGIIFANPYVRTGLAIASWLGLAGLVWDAANNQWVSQESGPGISVSDGYEYSISGYSYGYFGSPTAACYDVAGRWNQNGPSSQYASYTTYSMKQIIYSNGIPNTCVLRITTYQYDFVEMAYVADGGRDGYQTLSRRISSCPSGWYSTPAGCVQTAPQRVVTKEDFQNDLDQSPMPERVPLELPPNSPLPVEPPFINPEPGANPQHRPMFVPSGNPVPNPNYDPGQSPSPANQPYMQPGVRVVPTPTTSNPTQVDMQPVNRPVTSADPNPNPVTEANPNQNPNDKPKPDDKPGLCELYPDILACVKLDQPEDADLPNSEKPISITPDSGWGADNAACPAPRMLNVQGRQIPIPFDLFCTYMNGMRPIIIAMAWLSAAFILLGARESN